MSATAHPDEGQIHAWLDDALGGADAARVAEHIASCGACSALAAEARGLVAGASRVVRALDPEGAASEPAWGSAVPGLPRTRDAHVGAAPAGEGSLWRALRVTPARAAMAATLLVAIGITLTHDWVADDAAVLQKAGSMASVALPDTAAGPRDALLDSAIARNIAEALPPRTVQRAPGPEIPTAPAAPAPAASVASPVAGLQVAAGRRAAQARSDTARVVAEQSGTAVSRIAAGAAAAAEPTQQLQGRVAGVTMDVADAGTGQQCFRIESDDPETTWGPVRLPLVVALRGTGSSGVARVTGGTGGETIDAPWRRTAGDTLHLELRRIGYSGAIDLAGGDTVREGTMRSAPAAMQPGQVVTSAIGGAASNARRRAAPATRAAATPAAAKASAARSAAAGVAVTARPVRCP